MSALKHLLPRQDKRLRLISYYARSHPTASNLQQPTTDPTLSHICPPKDMYPESTGNKTSNVPAVTRGAMPGSPYVNTLNSRRMAASDGRLGRPPRKTAALRRPDIHPRLPLCPEIETPRSASPCSHTSTVSVL
ncbi:hypothetical protein K469DRAFT_707476, partial [Zopfia rhizophila CBS 207.26]